MAKKNILFINQEIHPYVPESDMSIVGHLLPESIMESGHEIRTFMPKWGHINERRNQLHEVIRLSGLNIIIGETDHSLLIKVASIQPSRMQVYFIDNEDFFKNRRARLDEHGNEYVDNVERAIFYARGVLETLKKLRWYPEVIHCQGWMSCIVPLYMRTVYGEEAPFADCKIVVSGFEEQLTLAPSADIVSKIAFRNATPEVITATGIDFTSPNALSQLGIHFADGFINNGAPTHLTDYAREHNVAVMECAPGDDNQKERHIEFYDSL